MTMSDRITNGPLQLGKRVELFQSSSSCPWVNDSWEINLKGDPMALAELFKLHDLPCKCGHTHHFGMDTYEFYDLKMVTDDSPIQVSPRRTARCKVCKETLLLGSKAVLEKYHKYLPAIPE